MDLRIASNLLPRHHRDEERAYRAYARTGIDPLTDAGHETERAIARVDSRSRRAALVGALADLSAGDRDVLLLVAHAELTYAEIADALDLPTAERGDGPRSALRSLTFATVPTEPVDVSTAP